MFMPEEHREGLPYDYDRWMHGFRWQPNTLTMAAIVRLDGKNFEDEEFDNDLDITAWFVNIKGGLQTISLSVCAFAAAVFTLTN